MKRLFVVKQTTAALVRAESEAEAIALWLDKGEDAAHDTIALGDPTAEPYSGPVDL